MPNSITQKLPVSKTRTSMLLALLMGSVAQAQVSDDVVKLGLLLDLSGLYADVTGMGSVTAARMAVDDFGARVLGKPIEIVYADHNNKADIAASKAREWFDTQKVDALMDVAGSAAALAALDIAKQKHKIVVLNGPGSTRITNEDCNPYSVHYAYDTYALSNTTGRTLTQRGGDTWFFITADYNFGLQLQKESTEVLKAANGQVVGSVKHPLNASDFSSYLVQAQASKAKIIALANAGSDTINAIKTAHEFGLRAQGSQKIAALLMYINDVHSMGLSTSQGMVLTEGFYWDMDEDTRQWSRRYFEKMKKMPNMNQAGVYSATMHYLKAVQAAGTDDSDKVIAQMKSMPINDFFAKQGKIRADGRMVHDMYLFEVKTPAQSQYPWDYYKRLATVPGDQAFKPLSASTCPLVMQK